MKGLGQATHTEAIEALSRFDVVCVSEFMDACIAEIAIKLGCHPSDWIYHSEKRILGRPAFPELPPVIQKQIATDYFNDTAVWEAATEISKKAQEDVKGLRSATKWLAEHSHECSFQVSEGEEIRVGAKRRIKQPRPDCMGDESGASFASSFRSSRHSKNIEIDFPPYAGRKEDGTRS